MNFTLSTKPLVDALNLGIINSNVSKFYSKSCVVQLTATQSTLRINLEAARLVSEIMLKGKGDADGPITIFVDSLLFKQLVASLDTSTVTLEFSENSLIVHSGKSKFNLAKMADGGDLSLKRVSDNSNGVVCVFSKPDWVFVKNRQMYAIAMAFIHPIYTRVWVGEDGGVIVGDFDNGLFTYSKSNKLNTTCLLSDTIINLFNAIPEDSKLVQISDNTYQVIVTKDGFTLVSEFVPEYESDPNIGTYMADTIKAMMVVDPDNAVTVPTAAIRKLLSQADMLANSSEATIILGADSGQLYLHDNNVDGKIDIIGTSSAKFKVELKTTFLKSVIGDYPEDNITICALMQDNEPAGILVNSDNLSTMLSAVE